MNLDLYLILLTKINLKGVKDLGIRSDTIRFLEENIGKKLINIGLGIDFFFDMTSKTQTTKAKIKHESIYIAKEPTKKMKRQPFKEWEKNFVNHILDKRLISKNIKNSVNFTTKCQTNLVKNISNLSARYNSLTTQKQSI